MPRAERILETALYVADLAAAKAFYAGLLGADVMLDSHRLVALAVGDSVLLLFHRGSTAEPQRTPGGIVPGHGATGVQHLAFAIALTDLPGWIARIETAGLAIESVVDWPAGGRSLYMRDPDGHSVELATRGLWANYR